MDNQFPQDLRSSQGPLELKDNYDNVDIKGFALKKPGPGLGNGRDASTAPPARVCVGRRVAPLGRACERRKSR